MTTHADADNRDSGNALLTRELQLERLVIFHVAVLIILTAWAFGGNIDWARTLVAGWGTLSLPLLIVVSREVSQRRHSLPRCLHCLWPLLALNLIIGTSLFFPGFRTGTYEGDTLLIKNFVPLWLPSSAQPGLSLQSLWVFNGIYLSCFNLLIAIRSRHAFRFLLGILSVNALLLAVFGTLQKLSHAKGIYFGWQPSPQPKFFASFIYHNHWGAFTVLMLSIGLGLFFHYFRRHEGRDFMRSPAMLAATSVLLLAISVPLSGSRSCSLMALLLLLIAMGHWTWLSLRRRREQHRSRSLPILGALAALIIVVAVAYKLGEPIIRERLQETRGQIETMKEARGWEFRSVLYRDTWQMTRDRPLFGWGMASYPLVFTLYNTQDISPVDRLPHYYHDAHSDWLQSLAELGFIGTGLLALCGLAPLWYFRRGLGRSPISNYLLIGTAFILVYAWVEFPFGNLAVVIAFWLCLFTGLGYGRLETNRNSA